MLKSENILDKLCDVGGTVRKTSKTVLIVGVKHIIFNFSNTLNIQIFIIKNGTARYNFLT